MATPTIYEAKLLYAEHLSKAFSPEQVKQIMSETNSALRWGMEGIGKFTPKSPGRKVTKADAQAAEEVMKTLAVKTLQKIRKGLYQYFEDHEIGSASQNTYGARLDQLLVWAKARFGWHQAKSCQLHDMCCPPQEYRGSHSVQLPLTGRRGVYKRYRLHKNEMAADSREQMLEFKRFLTAPNYPGRVCKRVKDSTAETYIKEVELILGHSHHHKGVPKDELNFDLIVPLVMEEELATLSNIEQKKLWRSHQMNLETQMYEYFDFLESDHHSRSPHTHISKLVAVQRFCHFRYRDQVQRLSDYTTIPIFNAITDLLDKELEISHQWRRTKTTVADQSLKMPDPIPDKTALTTVRERVLQPIRHWCRHRLHRGDLRTGWAITCSTHNYLKLAFVCDIPPRRQSEFRNLKLAMSCPIDKPKDIPNGDYCWPLPPVYAREKDEVGQLCDNYIYKVFTHRGKYHPEGLWLLEIRDYKTDRVYGTYIMPLIDRRFEDGTHFYAYLDQYVCGYWAPKSSAKAHRYDWWDPALKGQRGCWNTKGVMECEPETELFEPQRSEQQVPWRWSWFFPAPKKGTQSKLSGFGRSYSQASYQNLEKRINPHFYRNLWATWAFQVGLSEQELQSLAYAMGMSVETMRNIYERCTPEEKTRPIREAIDRKLFQEMEMPAIDDTADQARVDRMKRELERLSPEERQRLLDELMGDDQVG